MNADDNLQQRAIDAIRRLEMPTVWRDVQAAAVIRDLLKALNQYRPMSDGHAA